MRSLTDRENRLIRLAAAGIVIYLALFYGWRFLTTKRAEYRQLVAEAQTLRQQVRPYQDKVLLVQKMMDDFHMDPVTLKRETVVANASAAIQQVAKSGGLQLGPIRESPARTAGSAALTTVQLESAGQVPATLTFLAGLNRLGFPVVVDSVQFSADHSRPGQVRMSLTLSILDFSRQKVEKPKPTEAAHA